MSSVCLSRLIKKTRESGAGQVVINPCVQFPAKPPAGRQSSTPASTPGSQPDHSPEPGTSGSSGGKLRWARGRDDGRLLLLAPTNVVTLTAGDHAQALCGCWLAMEGLIITHGLPGTLCLGCLTGVPGTDPGLEVGPLSNAVRARQSSGGG
jgi:hypothetical protein